MARISISDTAFAASCLVLGISLSGVPVLTSLAVARTGAARTSAAPSLTPAWIIEDPHQRQTAVGQADREEGELMPLLRDLAGPGFKADVI